MSWIIVLIILILFLITYLLWLRPYHLRWGASDAEVSRELPGDELVGRPDFNATRAVSIQAPPWEVWKWIIQIGSGRAGWYSIDWIDNGGKPSSSEVILEHQVIFSGQFIPFTPDKKNGMWVDRFVPEEFVLWTDKKGAASWVWYLNSEKGETRLITRLRTKYNWRSFWIIYYLIYDVGDIFMMKKCMTGIKQRAEKK